MGIINTQCTRTNDSNAPFHTTEYCGNHIYDNGELKQTLFDGGYLTYNGETPIYHFYVRDHLGNNRMVLDESGNIEQVTHYYPYGLPFAEGRGKNIQPYKFNGKELDAEDGLNWMDYGARMYDGALARWNGVDALAEKYNSVTTYGYCSGNPVTRVDVDGNGWYSTTDDKGNVTFVYNENVYSQEDLNKAGLVGKYMGIRMLINNNGKPDMNGKSYYSLWGKEYDIQTTNGAVIKAIDDGLINKMNEEIEAEYFNDIHINDYKEETSEVKKSYKINMTGLASKKKGLIKYAGAESGWYDNYSSSEYAYLTNALENKTTVGSDFFSMTKDKKYHLTLRNFNDSSGAILVDLQFDNNKKFYERYNAIKGSIIKRRKSKIK